MVRPLLYSIAAPPKADIVPSVTTKKSRPMTPMSEPLMSPRAVPAAIAMASAGMSGWP
jgi:hypothetical protein